MLSPSAIATVFARAGAFFVVVLEGWCVNLDDKHNFDYFQLRGTIMHMKPEKPKFPPKPQETDSRPQKPKPWKPQEGEPQACQHIKIIDCNKPTSRVFYECYHCQQGLLTECVKQPPVQEMDVVCPNCGRTSIKLLAKEVLSTTAIPSPWR
jgi:DNA-directed RNA polymerase subunit RPC12/RpoP